MGPQAQDAGWGEEDEEELQWMYQELANEVAELQSELHSTETEAKQLQMRLQAVVKTGGGGLGKHASPAAAMPPAATATEEEYRVGHLTIVLEWLAQHVDLHMADVLDVGFEVPIGGRVVHLRRVAQWPLPSAPGGRLRLTVPVEHQEGIRQLLAAVKAAGGKVEAGAVRRFAAVWDFVPGELATALPGGGVAGRSCTGSEPSVLLAHRCSTQGVLVANWPTREALEAFHLANTAELSSFRIGERVEVEYEGKWYVGVLHALDAEGKASVKCDTDPDGVLTMTPLYRVRKATSLGGQAEALSPLAAAAAAAGGPSHERAELPGQACSKRRTATGSGEVPARSAGAGHRRTRSSFL